MSESQRLDPEQLQNYLVPGGALRRVEHYALYLLNGMAAAGSGGLTDEDIDLAIDTAERLANKLVERGHIKPQQ